MKFGIVYKTIISAVLSTVIYLDFVDKDLLERAQGWSRVSLSNDFMWNGAVEIFSVAENFGVLEIWDDQVAVFLGNGNGTFQAPVYYSVGFEPWGFDRVLALGRLRDNR
jgi:hypothetical protein